MPAKPSVGLFSYGLEAPPSDFYLLRWLDGCAQSQEWRYQSPSFILLSEEYSAQVVKEDCVVILRVM
jgi:hypothetical protein